MIMYKNIDSVWINTRKGVTVYFSYNHLAGYMSCYILSACGIPNIQPFGKCDSIEDGRKQLTTLTQNDADKMFAEIQSWESNKKYPIEHWLEKSLLNPL
jgi:hypothetical protein